MFLLFNFKLLLFVEEALSLFLQSERILDDLELALEDKGHWSQHFVVRKWIDMPLWAEFRGFVADGKLTALSQYFAPCFFPELQGIQNVVAKVCQDLVEKIRHLIPNRVVADFAVVVNHGEFHVLLIEMNPFADYEGCGTSSCMFDWKADRAVLEGFGNNLKISLFSF
jgi:hypothetical protein